jgi:hypothetical protein
MSTLLINEPPLMVLPTLAKEVGLNEAIIIQQLHYWLNKSGKTIEGRKWIYNTFEQWQEQFPFWSMSTLKRTFKSLETKKILIADNYNQKGFDKTKWYTIDYEVLEGMNQRECQNDTMESVNMNQRECQNDTLDGVNMTLPIPENTQRITTEITTENTTPSSHKKIYDEQSDHYQLALKLYQNILENNPTHKKPNLQKWANDVRLMIERDGRTIEQIAYLMDWVQHDSFWKTNILSPSKLREKFDQLTIRVREDINRQNRAGQQMPRAYQDLQDWMDEE